MSFKKKRVDRRRDTGPTRNEQIRVPFIRVVDESGLVGEMKLAEALAIAKDRELDLVQISTQEVPVCKLMDYGKYAYEQSKKQKEKSKHKPKEIKTIKLSYAMDIGDLETRKKRTIQFLEAGYQVKIELRLAGRQNIFKDLAHEKFEEFLNKIKSEVEIKLVSPVKMTEGRASTIGALIDKVQ